MADSQVKKIKLYSVLRYKTTAYFYGTLVCGSFALVFLVAMFANVLPAREREAHATVLRDVRVYDARGDLRKKQSIAWRSGRLIDAPETDRGASVIDGGGGILTPGLIDVSTGLGLVDVSYLAVGREDSAGADDVRAAFRVSEVFDPASSVIPVARSGGITSALAVPRGGLVSGQSAWIDLAAGSSSKTRADGGERYARLVHERAALHISLARSTRISRGRRFLQLRRLFEALDAYRAGKTGPSMGRTFPADTLDLAELDAVLKAGRPVVFRVDRAAHIRAVLTFARERKLRPVIAGGAEAWKVAEELARDRVPVILNPIRNLPFDFDSRHARADAAAILHRAGVPVILSTFDTHRANILRQLAGNAVRAGLPHHAALAAVTTEPARVFGMSDRYGSLESGGVASLVLWSGDPFEFSSRVVKMWIGGREVTLDSRQTELLRRYRKIR